MASFPFLLYTVSLTPLFVLWWVGYSKGMVDLSFEKGISPDGIVLFLISIASLLFCHFNFIVVNNLYFFLLGFIPAYLIYRYFLSKPSIKQHLTKPIFIGIMVVLPLWGQALLKILNSTLDFGQNGQTSQAVESKYFSEVKDNFLPTVVFEDSPHNITSSIVVPYQLYEKIQAQDTIYLPVHKGAFGVSWTHYVYLGSRARKISIHSKSFKK
ncbi:hypothetical protein GCM10023231_18470 [Olivibacter ginsenosidimutans]|uniref:Uncharacterized protein n=2 Tax=Olivibacter ginsenosidimutans TaxID=1176537 RepID=A0ABP9B5B2_9SPHI